MTFYKFYDADLAGKELYDIRGPRYKRLLETCFRHSASVAMCIRPGDEEQFQSIERFRRKVPLFVKEQYARYGSFSDEDMDPTNTYHLIRYLLTPEVKRFILNRTDSIFQWTYAWGNNNPEDLTFFRPDGTVFFASVAREGVCFLYPEEDEDVTPILNDRRWITVERE